MLEREERARHSLVASRMLVKVGPSLGLLGTLIPMGTSLASLATGNLEAMAGQMVVAFTTTIIGLATGTLAYVVAAVRQTWVASRARAALPGRAHRGRAGRTRSATRRSADHARRRLTRGQSDVARFLHLPSPDEPMEEDPLAGIANLFDVSVVFIVGLMITLFSVYRIGDLVDPNSEVTMVKTNAQGEREIIVKKGTQITAYKVSGKTAAGDGERLGTAYRLADGQIIYVPEDGADARTGVLSRRRR